MNVVVDKSRQQTGAFGVNDLFPRQRGEGSHGGDRTTSKSDVEGPWVWVAARLPDEPSTFPVDG